MLQGKIQFFKRPLQLAEIVHMEDSLGVKTLSIIPCLLLELRELVEHKEEMMEDNCEQRMELYKELMKDYIQQTNGNDGAEKTQSNEQDETPVISYDS